MESIYIIKLMSNQKNVYGNQLQPCSFNPKTGFLRDAFCSCHQDDVGEHTICVVVTDDFLNFSISVGNDLSTPRPEYNFPGLKSGDQWCICLNRWIQSELHDAAPLVILESTNKSVLSKVSIDQLKRYEF